jgi:hypothetical protein
MAVASVVALPHLNKRHFRFGRHSIFASEAA